MNGRPARVLRGLVAAFFAVFVAALSHAAAGGGVPGTIGVVLALAFSSVLCVGLAGTSLSIIRLSLSVGLSQLALHTLFTVGPSAGSASLQPSGMGHHGSMLLSVSSAASAADAVGAASVAGTPATVAVGAAVAAHLCSWMWIAHAAAAIVTVLALRRGEVAFWGLVALAGRRFCRLLRPLFVEPTPRVTPDLVGVARRPDNLRDRVVLLGGLRHRGPPVCVRLAL